MAATPDVGTGATFTYGTSSYAAEILDITIGGISRAVIDTSHLGTTGARSKRPGDLYEPGTVTMNLNLDPDLEPVYTAAAETGTVTFPVPSGKSTGATLAASGFISEVSSINVPLEDKMTMTVVFQFADDHTWGNSAV